VVAARLDWARFSPGGGNINVLTSEKLTDLGNAATFYSVCVEVEVFRRDFSTRIQGGNRFWLAVFALS